MVMEGDKYCLSVVGGECEKVISMSLFNST